jgi:hypothetical protein
MATTTFEQVWLQSERPRSAMDARKNTRTGTLTITADSAEFRDQRDTLLLSPILDISRGRRGSDFVNRWIEVKFGEESSPSTVFLNDGLAWLATACHQEQSENGKRFEATPPLARRLPPTRRLGRVKAIPTNRSSFYRTEAFAVDWKMRSLSVRVITGAVSGLVLLELTACGSAAVVGPKAPGSSTTTAVDASTTSSPPALDDTFHGPCAYASAAGYSDSCARDIAGRHQAN